MSKDKLMTEAKYLVNKYDDTRDPTYAVELMKLILSKKIVLKTGYDGEVKFYPISKVKCKCQGCGTYYLSKEPNVFVLDGKGWHERCAPREYLQLPYYKTVKAQQEKEQVPTQSPEIN